MSLSLEQKNKDVVEQITKAKNENNAAKLRELFAPQFIAHISDWPRPLNRDEYIKGVQLSHQTFKPLVFVIEDMIAEGEKISARILVKGKHIGAYEQFLATHKEICFSGMLIRYICDGKVLEEWQVNDHLTMLKQMGLSVNHII